MRNLFYFIVGVLLAFCASLAFAADGWKLIAANSVPRATQSAACEDAKTLSGVPTDWTFSHINVTANGAKQCQWTRPNGDVGILGQILPFTCADPNVITNGVCGPKPVVCTQGEETITTFKTGTGPLGAKSATVPVIGSGWMKWPESDGTCNVAYVRAVNCESFVNAAGTGQDFYCTLYGKKTGTPTPASDNAQQPSEMPTGTESKPAETGNFNPATGQGCPAGTQNIGTDSTGGSICAGSGTNPSTATKVTEKLPTTTTTQTDGTNVKTEVTKVTNSDGSVTTNTKTTYTTTDGAERVHESSSTGNIPGTNTKGTSDGGGASGGSGGGGSSSDSDSFCSKNPNLNVCKNSTVAGDCENTSCEGDAIQCAILRQQRKIACEFSKADDMSRLGGNMLNDNDPLKGTFPTKDNARKVDMPQLNKNAFLGGGACFTDVQFTVQGRQFTIPFAKMCDYLIFLRGVVMLIASLASWKIVSRSVLG